MGLLNMDLNELIENIKENLTDADFAKSFVRKFAAFEKSRSRLSGLSKSGYEIGSLGWTTVVSIAGRPVFLAVDRLTGLALSTRLLGLPRRPQFGQAAREVERRRPGFSRCHTTVTRMG